MLDFFAVRESVHEKTGKVSIYPDFIVKRSKDLMVKGRSFHAIWDEEVGLWSTDEYDVQRLVDKAMREYLQSKGYDESITGVAWMSSFKSKSWQDYRSYVQNLADNSEPLDEKIVFKSDEVRQDDYATKRLPYDLEDGDYNAWDELVGTLYTEEERDKLEWAIGAVVYGDSKRLQKFLVLYGPPGTGKSTILDIVHALFEPYTSIFDAKALGSSGNQFATSPFKSNPLVGIDHDADMSRMDDNTVLNSLISHEDMLVNEKFKPSYTAKSNAFLFVGTNSAVNITDAKSGLIRRLIDVHPSGKRIPSSRYLQLMSNMQFQYGAIAKHCMDRYLELGRNYYDDYKPVVMMYQTDHVLMFVSDNYERFEGQKIWTTKQLYSLYKEYCEENGVKYVNSRQRLQNELNNYFKQYHERYIDEDGTRHRSVFTDFDIDKVRPVEVEEFEAHRLTMTETESIFDRLYTEQPAQYANDEGTPERKWDNVTTQLSDIMTGELHYVQVPENHIVIDFDMTDIHGEKDLDKNIEAASHFPPTYAELSKSGKGVHLHYIFEGDTSLLDPLYDEDIEIKVYRGNSSLRRKLTLCNNKPIAHISTGLPLKEKKEESDVKEVQSEQGLRNLISRNLRKEIHPNTKPSVEFIKKILDDAYESGLAYDISDMKKAVMTFASRSTNHGISLMRMVNDMHFEGQSDISEKVDETQKQLDQKEQKLTFFDVEVFPDTFIVCWKYQDAENVVTMEDPTPQEVGELIENHKLVGFNNRKYDNHILMGRYQGLSLEGVYEMSQRIIHKDRDAYIASAYGISHADIWDFSSKKQSLKKWEIELGIKHMENKYDWDKPIKPIPGAVDKVTSYCENDVLATEAVFNELKADYDARRLLADISGLRINDKTENHTAKIIFGDNRDYKNEFVYTDLSKEFPGYTFDWEEVEAADGSMKRLKTSKYKGEIIGEGGYVYAEPGIHKNVAVLDIASMHPTSIRELNLFGKYTGKFYDLVEARLAIKHGDISKAKTVLDGRLAPYIDEDDEEGQKKLSYALKIVINIVYGLTATSWDSKFSDKRNIDNIVAKRGALFMVDLKEMVQAAGYTAAHIKTDSIKIPNADDEIVQKVIDFGKKYGYTFEYDPDEDHYDVMALVNNAVLVARSGDHWETVGAQFQHPFVFKTLFSKEERTKEDLYETKEVAGGADIYMEFPKGESKRAFVGSIGVFCPVKPDVEFAADLLRVKDDKEGHVAGTKGHSWVTKDVADELSYDQIDWSYGADLVEDARKSISKVGDISELLQ